MAVRAVVLVCLILLVLPVFSDGPPGAKNADPNPEFFFTRVMYTDYRGRGPRTAFRAPISSTATAWVTSCHAITAPG